MTQSTPTTDELRKMCDELIEDNDFLPYDVLEVARALRDRLSAPEPEEIAAIRKRHKRCDTPGGTWTNERLAREAELAHTDRATLLRYFPQQAAVAALPTEEEMARVMFMHLGPTAYMRGVYNAAKGILALLHKREGKIT